MAFIGYNPDFGPLESTINSRKKVMLDKLESLKAARAIIEENWKGEDADAFLENYDKYFAATEEGIIKAYDGMAKELRKTHDEWKEKQSNGRVSGDRTYYTQ